MSYKYFQAPKKNTQEYFEALHFGLQSLVDMGAISSTAVRKATERVKVVHMQALARGMHDTTVPTSNRSSTMVDGF